MSALDRLIEVASQRFTDFDHVPIGLAVLSPDLVVLAWNATLETITDLPRPRAVGQSLASLNPVWSKSHYAGRMQGLFSGGPPVVFSPLLHPHIVPVSDRQRTFEVKATAVPDGSGGWWALLSVEEITVLARRVEELRELHARQDRMIREIHHRVKNNLNMISGLISMQKAHLGDRAGVEALDDLQSRIVAISEIHDLLHHSSGLTVPSAADYLESLAVLLDRNLSWGAPHRLELDLDPTIELSTDTTIILGLVQAELLTNALKYGLAQSDEVLTVRLRRDGPRRVLYELVHTGNRLPAGFDPASTSGLGMLLLSSYAAQLGTTLEWSADQSTRFALRFTA